MPEYVAMLRGINVGGRNRLPMRELAAMFVDAGCENVQTYIQSGNVLFDAEEAVAEEIPEAVSFAIDRDYGYQVPLLVRTAGQMAEVVALNPWIKAGVSEETLHVLFLQQQPEPELVAGLDPARSPGDAFSVGSQEIYLSLPHGVARSKLTTAYFDTALKTVSTSRNWRTVTKLLELISG